MLLNNWYMSRKIVYPSNLIVLVEIMKKKQPCPYLIDNGKDVHCIESMPTLEFTDERFNVHNQAN